MKREIKKAQKILKSRGLEMLTCEYLVNALKGCLSSRKEIFSSNQYGLSEEKKLEDSIAWCRENEFYKIDSFDIKELKPCDYKRVSSVEKIPFVKDGLTYNYEVYNCFRLEINGFGQFSMLMTTVSEGHTLLIRDGNLFWLKNYMNSRNQEKTLKNFNLDDGDWFNSPLRHIAIHSRTLCEIVNVDPHFYFCNVEKMQHSEGYEYFIYKDGWQKD